MSSKTGIRVTAAMVFLAAAWQCDAIAADFKAPGVDVVGQATVHFGDLDVDRPAGAAVLYRRIQMAAERVCGEPQQVGSFMISGVWRACVAQAIDRAVVAVDRPALTAYYRVHTAPSDEKASGALTVSLQR
jgi:UrcA family protein